MNNNNNNNNNSGEATPPYKSWNQLIEEEELDYEEEIITISDSEEDSPQIREEPPEVEEWGTPRWHEAEGESEAEDDTPEFASQWGDQAGDSCGGAGEGGQPEQPPQDEPPNTQCFRNWRTAVHDDGNVRIAHLQVNFVERIVRSRDTRLARARQTPPPGCAIEDGPCDATVPSTPGRQGEESSQAWSRERPQTPSLEVADDDRPPTPGRTLFQQPTPPPETTLPAPPPGFKEEDPETWPTELRDVLESLQEEYLLGERTGRTRVKRNIDGVPYRLRVRDDGVGRVEVLGK